MTRFSHSGMAGMTEGVEPTAFTELAVSDRFVVETEQAAANLAATEALALIDRFNRPVIVGSSGYPGLRRLPLVSHRRPTRRAVVYAPTILKGFRQFFPPLLPDVIYLDTTRICALGWQPTKTIKEAIIATVADIRMRLEGSPCVSPSLDTQR